MKDNLKMFRFTTIYKDNKETVERFIIAKDEEEAIDKMEDFRNAFVSRGFADFIYNFNPTVEMENLIF